MDTITVNGIEYVRAGQMPSKAPGLFSKSVRIDFSCPALAQKVACDLLPYQDVIKEAEIFLNGEPFVLFKIKSLSPICDGSLSKAFAGLVTAVKVVAPGVGS